MPRQMTNKPLQQSQPIIDPATNRRLIFTHKAHATFDLRGLLIPWLTYKVYFRLKPSERHGTKQVHSKTMYGDEHSCSYKQCMAGYAKEITLDRTKGYQELIDLVERKMKGQHISAKIYGRDPDTDAFDHLHRVYINGKIEKERVNDPVIDPLYQYRTIYFKIEKDRLILSDKSPELTIAQALKTGS